MSYKHEIDESKRVGVVLYFKGKIIDWGEWESREQSPKWKKKRAILKAGRLIPIAVRLVASCRY